MRYLKSALGQGIFSPSVGILDLVAYSDSDWNGCEFNRRSRTRYIITLRGSPISRCIKKQPMISRSPAKAKYRAMATTVSKVLWLCWLLNDLEATLVGPNPLYCDNQVTQNIANNLVFHERTKHVEINCYFIRERVESQEIKTECIDTKIQITDIFTKSLNDECLRFLLSKLGARDLHSLA